MIPKQTLFRLLCVHLILAWWQLFKNFTSKETSGTLVWLGAKIYNTHFGFNSGDKAFSSESDAFRVFFVEDRFQIFSPKG